MTKFSIDEGFNIEEFSEIIVIIHNNNNIPIK